MFTLYDTFNKYLRRLVLNDLYHVVAFVRPKCGGGFRVAAGKMRNASAWLKVAVSG